MPRQTVGPLRPSPSCLVVLGALVAFTTSCKLDVTPPPQSTLVGNVGLDIDLVNGSGGPLRVSSAKRLFYINQIRFQVRQTAFPAADVLDWLAKHSELSTLDWTGVNTVKTEYEGSPGDYEEIRGYLDARWMADNQSFTLTFVDAQGKTTAGPIKLEDRDFVIARKVAMSWAEHQVAKGDNGSNKGDYSKLTVSSGGTYTGPEDDIYQVTVAKSGPLGTAEVKITSVRKDDSPASWAIVVTSGKPIPLGTAGRGATITFTGDASVTFVEGDRWLIRCTRNASKPEESVGAATPGPHAVFAAQAEIRLGVPDTNAQTFTIPAGTTKLQVRWSGQPDKVYERPVELVESKVGYGLQARVVLDPLAGGGNVYKPGGVVSGRVLLLDENGKPLHEPDDLPTYADFIKGRSNGIAYYRATGSPNGKGYFAEHRLNIMTLRIIGPRHFIEQRYDVAAPTRFFTDDHAYPDLGAIVFPGFRDPKVWDTPISTSFSFKLPKDARSGTYLILLKAQRSFLGQNAYRLEEVEVQVGDATRTDFVERSGNCEVCHSGKASLAGLRHGTTNPRVCVSCHLPTHGLICEIVHAIHLLSTKFVLPKNDCSLCHLAHGSNTRPSKAVCGSCHQSIHPGEPGLTEQGPYDRCASSCHSTEPLGHVRLPPL